jgi:hypothetical protein
MRRRTSTYTAYGIGCFIVWALIFTIGAMHPKDTHHAIVLLFAGWALGSLSATIARYVYPPPKKWSTGRRFGDWRPRAYRSGGRERWRVPLNRQG